jgi:hypothetical protein
MFAPSFTPRDDHCLEKWSCEQRISPPKDNFTPRGQNSPLGDNFAPGGQLRPWGSNFAPRFEVKNGPLLNPILLIASYNAMDAINFFNN